MAKLDRGKVPQSKFALSGKRFPLNDKKHDRLAIGGATRAERAGNISHSTAEKIKSEARAKLHPHKSSAGREVERRLNARDKHW